MAKDWLEMVEKQLLITPHLFRLIIEGFYFPICQSLICGKLLQNQTDYSFDPKNSKSVLFLCFLGFTGQLSLCTISSVSLICIGAIHTLRNEFQGKWGLIKRQFLFYFQCTLRFVLHKGKGGLKMTMFAYFKHCIYIQGSFNNYVDKKRGWGRGSIESPRLVR